MVFDGRRLWFFHGEENFTATPCRLFYVARERISPIMGVRIFTTLWVWQILHGVVSVVMWSINLNWLSLAEMLERKCYYIYIIYILYIYNKILFAIFPPLFCFTDHVATLTTLTTPLTKSLCFLWCHHGGRGHWMVGVFSPVRVCVIRKLYPFWRQHSRKDSGRWVFGAVAGFVPICRWRRTGKRQNVYKVYTKTTEISVKCGFYAFVYRNVGHRKLLIPKYYSSFASLKTEMSYKQIF